VTRLGGVSLPGVARYHNPVITQWPGRDRDYGASNQPPGLFDGGGATKRIGGGGTCSGLRFRSTGNA